MKTVVIHLLSVVLVLFCSPGCDRKGRFDSSESLPVDPQAIREAVHRYLSADTSPHNQEANVLRLLDTRVVPYLIEAALAAEGKDEEVYYLLGHALGELREDARRRGAPELLRVLTDEDSSVELAEGILSMIGYLKEPGLVIEAQLIELRQTRPELEASISQALIGIRSTQCGSIYAALLAEGPDVLLLRDTAEARTAATDAGPEVVELLGHSDWDIRLAAARTLGFIGYAQAIPALIELLDEPTDVRLNWVAAESLGRLGTHAAVDALRKTADEHWHPAVRGTARIALQHIAASKPYESEWHEDNFPLEYFDYDYWGIESSVARKPDFLQEPFESKLYRSAASRKMQGLSYEAEIVSYGARDEGEQIAAKGEDAIIVVNRDNMVVHREPIEQVPDVALRVENGWLVGSNRGEWGGELVFVADDGQRTYVLKENVNDLFRLGERCVAVTGLSHLFTNSGLIYEVRSVERGRWFCEPWRALPGAPELCGKLPSGEIFIRTSGGGDIILAPDGTFRMAPQK